jgi:hypothetical protein
VSSTARKVLHGKAYLEACKQMSKQEQHALWDKLGQLLLEDSKFIAIVYFMCCANGCSKSSNCWPDASTFLPPNPSVWDSCISWLSFDEISMWLAPFSTGMTLQEPSAFSRASTDVTLQEPSAYARESRGDDTAREPLAFTRASSRYDTVGEPLAFARVSNWYDTGRTSGLCKSIEWVWHCRRTFDLCKSVKLVWHWQNLQPLQEHWVGMTL